MSTQPLAGVVVGVTADRRADTQIKLLEARGATCVHGPVIQTHPVESVEDLRTQTQAIIDRPPEVMVMTTGLGVRTWFGAADDLGIGVDLRRALAHTEFLARGPKASSAIANAGFPVAWTAPRYDGVIDRLVERGVRGVRVGLQRDGSVRGDLTARMAALGADVVEVPVYRWTLPSDPAAAEALIVGVIDGSIHALTFTAKPAIEHLFELADHLGVAEDLNEAVASRTELFCVGPVCATGFDHLPGARVHVPEKFQLAALVQLTASHFAGG